MAKLNRKSWIIIGGWFFLFFFLFNMLNYFQPWQIALYNACFELFAIIFMYYFTSYYLFPKFYKYGTNYIVISMVTVLVFSVILALIYLWLVPELKIDKERPPKFFHFFRFFTTLGFSYFVSTSVNLINQATKYKENEKVLMEEKLQTELKLLKAQINPHFIFNALNNIYSLTFMKADNAPDSILKLSEMLRYVFYDCSKDKVQLSAEMKYVENFVSFQQMKSEHEQKISLHEDIDSSVEVAPMLLIPLIENAFKYSRIEEEEHAFVDIGIQKKGDLLRCTIENSIPPENKVSSGSGMGIKNVEHRLQIIYPGKYELKINEQEDVYQVLLTLNLE